MNIRVMLPVLLVLMCAAVPARAQESVVRQARADLAATGFNVERDAACVDFEIAKIVAGRLASQGAGLLTKDCCGDFNDPNRTHCEYQGQGYSHDIVAFPNGTIVDIAIGDGHNSPSWQASDPDPSLIGRYRSAASLGLTGLVPGSVPGPDPTPVPVPSPGVDLTSLQNDVAALKAQVTQLHQAIDDLNRQIAAAQSGIDGAVTASSAAAAGVLNLKQYLQAHPLADGCKVSFLGCHLTFNTPAVQ